MDKTGLALRRVPQMLRRAVVASAIGLQMRERVTGEHGHGFHVANLRSSAFLIHPAFSHRAPPCRTTVTITAHEVLVH